MWKSVAFAAGLILAGSAMASAVSAQQPQCNDRDNVLALLAKKYKETPVAAGVTSTGGLVEVLSNDKGGTWTIIVTSPKGVSCLVAAGEGWRQMEQIALDPEA
jgi:hypothetical protein